MIFSEWIFSPKMALRWVPLLFLPFLVACSDQGATFEIKGSAHSLSLTRTTTFPWDKTAHYAIVASHMPDCMRKHALPDAALDAKVDVFSPGNDAWIIRQSGRMFVTETRTCEGFASLDKVPEGGLGVLTGSFEMRGSKLIFTAAPPPVPLPSSTMNSVPVAPSETSPSEPVSAVLPAPAPN